MLRLVQVSAMICGLLAASILLAGQAQAARKEYDFRKEFTTAARKVPARNIVRCINATEDECQCGRERAAEAMKNPSDAQVDRVKQIYYAGDPQVSSRQALDAAILMVLIEIGREAERACKAPARQEG